MNTLSRVFPTILQGIKRTPIRLHKSALKVDNVLGAYKSFHSLQAVAGSRPLYQRDLLAPNFTSVLCSAATHSTGDKELQDFLNEEIAAEKKAQKFPKPPKMEGFEVSTEGSDVKLTKKFNDEIITVKLNVNHTVDTELPEGDIDVKQDKAEIGEMKSKPDFTVNINKGGKVLAFTCSFVEANEEEPKGEGETFNDLFNIDELAIHDGEWKDSTYAVSGEIMDGYLYDLLMNLLEERGVSNEFVEQLSNYSTAYEHKLYIGLLENLKGFVGAK